MEEFLQDFRYALRHFTKSPGFVLVCILTLAVGIGLNGAIFSFVNMLLFRKLPLNLVQEPERLVFLWSENQQQGLSKRPASVDALTDWQQVESFQAVAGGYNASLSFTGGQTPFRMNAFRITPGFFSLVGVQPARGRGFLAEESLPGADRVVILSHRAWQRHFGGDPQILSQTIRLDGAAHRVVGIMPSGFYMPAPNIDLFLPLGVAPGQRGRDDRFLMVVARLAPGVSQERAQAEMDAVSQRLAATYPDTERGWRVQVKPLLEEMYDGGVVLSALVLLIAVGLVLLLACANVGGLLLARATSRAREVALRTCLGASRSRLLRQLLTESLVLALCGGTAGVLLAVAATRFLGQKTGGVLQLVGEVGVDPTTLLFMILISLLSTVVFGLFPALQTSRPDLAGSLKEGTTKASISRKSRRMLDAIVIGEVALSLVLLVGAGLMLRTMDARQEVDPGYTSSGLLTLRTDLPAIRYGEPQQTRSFVRRLEERLAALPGVSGVAIGSSFPADQGKPVREFLIEGRVVAGEGMQRSWSQSVAVSPGYLETLGIPLVEGRYLTAQDAEGTPRAAVLSKNLAARYWPGESALGKRFRFPGDGSEAGWVTVVGVVGDLEHYNVYNGPLPLLFVPLSQRPERTLSIALRTAAADPMTLAPAVRQALTELDPDQPFDELQPMEAVISDNFAGLRLITLVLGVFGVIALLLAALGTYGVISYSVGQRSYEIGVRMALGALRWDVLRMILTQAGRLALVGIAFGMVGALGLSRLMSSLLFGVGTMDPVTFGGMAAVLLAVALLASFLPGRRASLVDPNVTLRSQ